MSDRLPKRIKYLRGQAIAYWPSAAEPVVTGYFVAYSCKGTCIVSLPNLTQVSLKDIKRI